MTILYNQIQNLEPEDIRLEVVVQRLARAVKELYPDPLKRDKKGDNSFEKTLKDILRKVFILEESYSTVNG